MASAENRSMTRARITRGSRSPTRSTAAAISSTEETMNPVSPSATTSGTDPLRQAPTGVPQAMASVMTRPKGSAHWIGKARAAAWLSRSAFCSWGHSPWTSTSSPRIGSTCSGPVAALALVLGGDTHHQPPPGPPGRLDGQVRRLLLVGPAEEEHVVVLVLAQGIAVHRDAVVDHPAPAQVLRGHGALALGDGHEPVLAGHPAVEHVRLLGERPVQGVDGRAVAEGADADPDRAGVVVEDVELVAVLVDRDDVAGLVPGVADGVAGRLLVERRHQPGLGPRPWGGEQGDVVAAVGQPVGQQRHHPLDAAVAAGRDAVPGGSDEGDAHGASSNPRREGVRSTRSGTSTTIAQQTRARSPEHPPGPGRRRAGGARPSGSRGSRPRRTPDARTGCRPAPGSRCPGTGGAPRGCGRRAAFPPWPIGRRSWATPGAGPRPATLSGAWAHSAWAGALHSLIRSWSGGRGCRCVGCRARSGEAPAHPVVPYSECSAGACWTLMTTTSPSLR